MKRSEAIAKLIDAGYTRAEAVAALDGAKAAPAAAPASTPPAKAKSPSSPAPRTAPQVDRKAPPKKEPPPATTPPDDFVAVSSGPTRYGTMGAKHRLEDAEDMTLDQAAEFGRGYQGAVEATRYMRGGDDAYPMRPLPPARTPAPTKADRRAAIADEINDDLVTVAAGWVPNAAERDTILGSMETVNKAARVGSARAFLRQKGYDPAIIAEGGDDDVLAFATEQGF